ncbi:TadE/TadG family type IV pilus assembly protein [Occallatibacter savannae]|uniref:TadE/TadG family type IV pilus assembly protein n=1 Tax=Occallatibacter savannae TaxID=1002691 RepID=UPI000D691697|nr:TadE/TadG family type IV pilus assembly protein [Occallatibacter savannae]
MISLLSFPRSENPTLDIRSICHRLQKALTANDRGSAIAETAVAMPIILLVMTGIFSFSVALHQKLALAEAVSAGGRVLAVERGDTDPCQKATDAIYAAAPTLSRSNMTISYVLNGVAIGSGVTSCPNTPNMVATGSAQITATYPVSVSIYGKSFGNLSLQTQLSEAIQ